jgi:alpha-tubulin suppressor-like RCC1 family protein
MPAATHFTQIATNNGYVLAIDQGGHLWSWGNDSSFLIGTVTSIPPPAQEPVEVATPAGVTFKAISVGRDFALAVDASGKIWAWGSSDEGNLGIDTRAAGLPTPTEVATPPGVIFTAVSAGINESVALDSTGRAWAWGDANGGDLGVNASSVPTGEGTCQGNFGGFCSYAPLEVNTPPGVTLTAVAAGSGYDAALDSTGRIWTWGTSNQGALGLGTALSTCATACLSQAGQPELAENSAPAAVVPPAGVRFTSVAVTEGENFNYQNTVAVDSNGTLWAWGSNAFLQLTKNTSPCPPSPLTSNLDTGVCVVKPTQLPGPAGVRFQEAAATNFAVLGYPR